jgi:hypothetical protein
MAFAVGSVPASVKHPHRKRATRAESRDAVLGVQFSWTLSSLVGLLAHLLATGFTSNACSLFALASEQQAKQQAAR